jgi:protein-tyrosine phosphatase
LKIQLCFVCLGNICRSPTAEGIMHALVAESGLAQRIVVDSAGTSAWHVGEAADPRSRQCALERGVELPSRARQFVTKDFGRFDYVLAMDSENHGELAALAPDAGARTRVHLLRSFDPASPHGADVPDPYYGGERGFDDVFEICEAACRGLLLRVIEDHSLEPR